MIGVVLTTLKGGTLWAVVAIVLGVLGAATYLASQGIMSGGDVLTLFTAILAAVGIVTGAHVAGQTAAAAFNTPAPGPNVSPPTPTALVPANPTPGLVPNAAQPAMPTPGG